MISELSSCPSHERIRKHKTFYKYREKMISPAYRQEKDHYYCSEISVKLFANSSRSREKRQDQGFCMLPSGTLLATLQPAILSHLQDLTKPRLPHD
jgi:hypothetical protein